MIPRRWIRKQLDEAYEAGVASGYEVGQHVRIGRGKWTKGHLVIGFVKGEKADDMLRAQDELIAFVTAAPTVRCKSVGVDIAAKEVFCELATTQDLAGLLAEMETACPSLKDGSASAGRFVRRFS